MSMPQPDVALTAEPSSGEVIATHPLLFVGALVLGAALGAGTTAYMMRMADDEAPIRVRNGSLELILDDTSQAWKPIGSSGTWRVKDHERPTDLFEVEVFPNQGATCSGSLKILQPFVRLTYQAQNREVITLDTPGHFTRVNPTNGVTLASPAATPYLLKYDSAGYLAEIAAGPNAGQLTPICSFANAQQLDHIEIHNP